MRRRISPLVPQDLQKAVPERASTEHKLLTDSPSPSPGDPLGEGVAPRVKAAVTDKILQEGRRPLLCCQKSGGVGEGTREEGQSSQGALNGAHGAAVGLAKKFIWLFRNSTWKNPNELFGQPNVYQLLWKNFVLLTSKR